MSAKNMSLFQQMYKNISEQNYIDAFKDCDAGFTFQIMGKSKCAGKFNASTLTESYFLKQKSLSQNTISIEVHDVLASDLHATVLATVRLKKDNQSIEYRTVHVWRIQGGKPVAGYEYPRDLYQYDLIWS